MSLSKLNPDSEEEVARKHYERTIEIVNDLEDQIDKIVERKGRPLTAFEMIDSVLGETEAGAAASTYALTHDMFLGAIFAEVTGEEGMLALGIAKAIVLYELIKREID